MACFYVGGVFKLLYNNLISCKGLNASPSSICPVSIHHGCALCPPQQGKTALSPLDLCGHGPGYEVTTHTPSGQWDCDRGCSSLSFPVNFPCFYGWGRGPIFPVSASVLFHVSSQRNKWEIECVHESEVNPIWKLKRWSRWRHLFWWWFS